MYDNWVRLVSYCHFFWKEWKLLLNSDVQVLEMQMCVCFDFDLWTKREFIKHQVCYILSNLISSITDNVFPQGKFPVVLLGMFIFQNSGKPHIVAEALSVMLRVGQPGCYLTVAPPAFSTQVLFITTLSYLIPGLS